MLANSVKTLDYTRDENIRAASPTRSLSFPRLLSTGRRRNPRRLPPLSSTRSRRFSRAPAVAASSLPLPLRAITSPLPRRSSWRRSSRIGGASTSSAPRAATGRPRWRVGGGAVGARLQEGGGMEDHEVGLQQLGPSSSASCIRELGRWLDAKVSISKSLRVLLPGLLSFQRSPLLTSSSLTPSPAKI